MSSRLERGVAQVCNCRIVGAKIHSVVGRRQSKSSSNAHLQSEERDDVLIVNDEFSTFNGFAG